MGTSDEKAVAPVGLKFDGDKKERWDLMPWKALSGVARVLAFGARKYGPDNWRKVEGWRSRYFAALLRHVVAWTLGEKNDPETGEHHMTHAICCALFIAELDGCTVEKVLEEAGAYVEPNPFDDMNKMLEIQRKNDEQNEVFREAERRRVEEQEDFEAERLRRERQKRGEE